MTLTRLHLHPRAGSALVSTMLVIVVLSIIVVAFLQSMTVERQTARSYLNRYKAELAARAGLNSAIAKIQKNLPKTEDEAKKGFITWTWATDPSFAVTYTGLLTDIFNTAGEHLGVDRTVWLFSSRTAPGANGEDSTAPDKIDSDKKNQYDVNAAKQVNASTSPIPVDWVDIPDQPTARYAYWVSDESGRLDITRLGNSGNLTKNTGKITDLKIPEVPTSELTELISKKDLLAGLSVTTPRQIAPSLDKSPASFGVDSNRGSDLIHYGAMAMQPRTNINTLFTSSGTADTFVTNLDTFVSKALPDYYRRKDNRTKEDAPLDTTLLGTFKRIAASAYDYIDSSSTPTLSPNLKTYFSNYATATSPWPGADTANTYYGIKPVPRINEYAVYYGPASATGKYSSSSIDITRYVELWNMSQKSVTLSTITVRLFSQQRGGSSVPPLDETITNWQPATVTIPANGFVTLTSTTTYPASLPSSFDSFRTSLSQPNTGIILAAVIDNNGSPKVIDGFYPLTLQPSASAGKAGVSPGYSGSGDTSDTRTSLGRFLTKWSSVTGTAHSFTPARANNTATDRKYQNLGNWFDQPQIGDGQGVSPTSAPSYIKGAPMDYIGELGNIWDPSKDSTDGTGKVRGGKTLVIGQFDPFYRVTNGAIDTLKNSYADYLQRADAALLDVLTANEDPRINVNSPRPTSEPDRPLAILGSSLTYATDDVFPQAQKPTYDYTALENSIIARLATPEWKDARPFRNANDLVLLPRNAEKLPDINFTAKPFVVGTGSDPITLWSSIDKNPLWKASPPLLATTTIPTGPLVGPATPASIKIDAGDDRSREEGFRRISNWVSFASLSYRIQSAGQILDPKGVPVSRARMQAIVTFIPKVTKKADNTTDSITYTPKIQFLPTE